MVTPAAGARPSVLSLNITSKSALYAAYMPFLERGGLFVPTTREYLPGDEIFMLVALMDDPARLLDRVAQRVREGARSKPSSGPISARRERRTRFERHAGRLSLSSGFSGTGRRFARHPAPDGGQWRRCRALRWRHLGAISCRA